MVHQGSRDFLVMEAFLQLERNRALDEDQAETLSPLLILSEVTN